MNLASVAMAENSVLTEELRECTPAREADRTRRIDELSPLGGARPDGASPTSLSVRADEPESPEPAEEPAPSWPPESVTPLQSFGSLSASSLAMQRTFALLARIAATDLTVTLLGETGSGKDVLARTLHAESRRSQAPLVVFDCGAVAPNLAESELFGHERGAFTGAHALHLGAFERAEGGTLFLDEIAELPLDLQPRLLRALENRSVRRVGGREHRPIDIRVIAATNRDLKRRVAEGSFRQDLYFRLAAAVVPVAPLRARLEDLPLLTHQILTDLGHPDLEVAPATFEALRSHDWPGNVRELKNTLACALAFVDGGILEQRHVTPLLHAADNDQLEQLPLAGRTLEQLERAAIKQTLRHSKGIKSHAAKALGIAVSTLYEKLKKYDLERPARY